MQLDFLHTNLGYRQAGDIVEVTLQGNAANVRLMDSGNFQSYRNGRARRYIGGLAKQSPIRLQIPSSGSWHLTVDMQGLQGSTRSSVRVIPRAALSPLPPISTTTRSPLQEIARNIAELPPNVAGDARTREYDVFISHATEDKVALVRPLAHALQERGLAVWYDEFELKVGDSLRRKIDGGITRSRFGLVVISISFFQKGWPQYELDGLVTMSISGKQVLLPIWHGVSKDEVVSYSPSLADKVALRSADMTVDEMADEIASVVAPGRP